MQIFTLWRRPLLKYFALFPSWFWLFTFIEKLNKNLLKRYKIAIKAAQFSPTMTILMASSKTFLSPLWLRAEHSRNFLQRIFLCCRDFTRLLAWTKQDMIHHHMIILRSKGVGWGNLSKCPHLRVGDHLLVLLLELLDLLGVVPEVRLGAHQQYRGVRAVVRHLGRRAVKLLFNKDTTSRSPVDNSTKTNIVTSGIHLDSTLSKLVGLVRAKHTRNMSWNINKST